MEIRRNLCSREDRRIHSKILVRCEGVGNVRQVERGYEWERAPNVEGYVGVSIVMSAGISAANDQLVTASDEPHYPVVTGSWIPVEANPRLKVIGITIRNRIHTEACVIA